MQGLRSWIIGSYLVASVLTWMFFYYLSDTVWDIAGLPVMNNWSVQPPQIIAFISAIVVFIGLNRSEKVGQFSGEAASELAKVTWPERKETILSAGVVAVMIAICAAILALYDVIWGTLIGKVY